MNITFVIGCSNKDIKYKIFLLARYSFLCAKIIIDPLNHLPMVGNETKIIKITVITSENRQSIIIFQNEMLYTLVKRSIHYSTDFVLF